MFTQYATAWKDNKAPSSKKVIIDRNTYFKKTKIPEDKYNRFLDYITISKDEFVSKHRGKYSKDFGPLNDFNILRNKPLIAINKNQSVSINFQWLYEILGEGVFWIINDLLGKGNNESFRTFFGELYQIYFSNIFQRIYPTDGLQKRAFYDVLYDNGKRSSDAILYYPGTLVLFEAKWPTLRMDQTMIPGDLEAFNYDCDNIIVHAAKQLDRNINDFKTGRLPLEGIDPSDIHTFYPIIVTARPFPVGLLLTQYILDRVKQAGFLCSSKNIRTLEIITIEELEYLEPLIKSGKTFPDILNRKQASSYYAELPMKWHIYKNEITDSIIPHNEYIEALFTELSDNIRKELFL